MGEGGCTSPPFFGSKRVKGMESMNGEKQRQQETSPNTGVVKPQLTRAQSFKVAHWCDLNWDRMKALTRDQAAEQCANACEFRVSKSNLVAVIKDMGKTFPGIVRKGSVTTGKDRTATLARVLLVVINDVRKLAFEC